MNENEFSIALGADDGAGIGNVLSKTTRPDYPAETPTFSQKKKWREAWRDSLQTAGLAAVLRGEVPFELLKLQPRPLIPETDQSSDNIKVANADIANKNRINREELEGRIREIKTRLGAAICASLRPHAPLKLEKLKKDYPLLNASGTAIPDAYDGVEMFKKLDSDDTVSEYESDLHQKYYERLRDKKLPENCSPQMYCSRINLMVSKINPNLPDPLSGAKLSKFILEQLPSNLGADTRRLKSKMQDEGTWDDASKVQGTRHHPRRSRSSC